MEVFSKLFKDFKNFIEDLKKKFSIKEILKKINRHRTLYPSNLSKDFKKSLSRLKRKYGEEFEYINGIHPDQLDFSSFIDNFIDNDTLADSSIDPNANANHKDIRSFMSEKGKSSDKLFGLNKIYYEIKKRWGKKTAEEWLEQEYSRGFYLNDSTTASFFPYCFSGDTKIMTKTGLHRLDELVDEDEIFVLNKNHGWEKATVERFGKQELVKLTLERNGNTKEFMVTKNHRWFVRNKKGKSILTTEELEAGMRIPFNTAKGWSNIKPSPFGIAHGFFTGDGDKGSKMRVNFCGDKRALLPYFTPATITGDENELVTYGVPKYFKELPNLNESVGYLYGWLVGLFASDGCIDIRGRCTISSTKKEVLECVQNIQCVLGMPIGEIHYQDRISNLTGMNGRVYSISLNRKYLKDDFFIRPTHIEKWNANKDKEPKDKNWIVKSVEETGIIDDVYCAVSEETHSFTLEGNVLTHNCWANDFSKLAKEGLFFLDNYNNEAPKHLTTYFDDVIEFVSFLSNRQSGGFAPSCFFSAYQRGLQIAS